MTVNNINIYIYYIYKYVLLCHSLSLRAFSQQDKNINIKGTINGSVTFK